jgi:hypothetical protein
MLAQQYYVAPDAHIMSRRGPASPEHPAFYLFGSAAYRDKK